MQSILRWCTCTPAACSCCDTTFTRRKKRKEKKKAPISAAARASVGPDLRCQSGLTCASLAVDAGRTGTPLGGARGTPSKSCSGSQRNGMESNGRMEGSVDAASSRAGDETRRRHFSRIPVGSRKMMIVVTKITGGNEGIGC